MAEQLPIQWGGRNYTTRESLNQIPVEETYDLLASLNLVPPTNGESSVSSNNGVANKKKHSQPHRLAQQQVIQLTAYFMQNKSRWDGHEPYTDEFVKAVKQDLGIATINSQLWQFLDAAGIKYKKYDTPLGRAAALQDEVTALRQELATLREQVAALSHKVTALEDAATKP